MAPRGASQFSLRKQLGGRPYHRPLIEPMANSIDSRVITVTVIYTSRCCPVVPQTSSPRKPTMAEDEDWRKLCEAAVNEKDVVKLLQITAQINRILAERERLARWECAA